MTAPGTTLPLRRALQHQRPVHDAFAWDVCCCVCLSDLLLDRIVRRPVPMDRLTIRTSVHDNATAARRVPLADFILPLMKLVSLQG